MKTILTSHDYGTVRSGCANNRDMIAKASFGNRQDVFTEVTGKEAQSGKAPTDFKFTVKSNFSRFMWIYNKHTDPPYHVHLNIDDQTTTLLKPVYKKTMLRPYKAQNFRAGVKTVEV